MNPAQKAKNKPAAPTPVSDGKTRTDIKVGHRAKSAVMKDFERVAGPLRGRNREGQPEE